MERWFIVAEELDNNNDWKLNVIEVFENVEEASKMLIAIAKANSNKSYIIREVYT